MHLCLLIQVLLQRTGVFVGTFGLTPTTADPDLSFNVCVDLVRETTKLTSSEIYADQTVPQDNIFTDIVNQISEYDKLITVDLVHGIFLNPETQFVTEKISGPNAADYEKNCSGRNYFILWSGAGS